MNNTLYVGIDVSSKSNVVYLMLTNGDKFSNFSVANSQDGSKQLVKRIHAVMISESLDTVVIGLESTSVYGDNLVYFLREDATLSSFNKKIHVLNPRQVKKFHDAYNDLPKNDYVDSFVIADCLRFGRINKEVYMGDYHYKALQNLTRARYFAVCNLIKEKQRFMNVLFKKYSTMTQEKVFSNTFSTTALAVYEEFDSAEALANMDLHELTYFIIEKGKNRFPNPDSVAKAIQKAAKSSYRLPKTVNDSVNQVLSISITSIKALESQIKEFDKAIKAQMELLPNVLISIPGIGPVLSAGIMAEIGDINRFENQAGLAKYAGFAWRQHQSGKFESTSNHMTKRGSPYLRYALFQSALRAEFCDPVFSDYYQKKITEGKHHLVATNAVARKLVHTIFAVLTKDKPYQVQS